MTIEDRLRDSLRDPAWEAQASGITLDGVVRRARRRGQLIATGAVLGSAAAVAAIVLAVNAATGGGSGPPPLHTPSPTPSAGPVEDTSILGVTSDHRYVIQQPDGSRQVVNVPAPQGDRTPLVASRPDGGWIVTTEPVPPDRSGPETGLAEVDVQGHVTDLSRKLGLLGGYATALAVAPDGTVALGLVVPAGVGGAAQAELAVVRPGGGPIMDWPVAASANEIRALAWDPDSRHLRYIVGMQTGAGVWGAISTWDTRGRVGKMIAAQPQRGPAAQCQFDGVAPSAGGSRPAGPIAMGSCGRGPERLYRPSSALVGWAAGLTFRPVGCVDGQLHGTPGSPVLLATWCGKVYRVDRGRMEPVPGNFTDAAASATSGYDGTGHAAATVVGSLHIVGGPYPGIDRLVDGTVEAHTGSVHGPVTSTASTNGGRFSFALPPGRYFLTGSARSVVGVGCVAHPVVVGPTPPTPPVHVRVICPVP